MIDALFFLLISYGIYRGISRGLILGIFSSIAYFFGLAAGIKLSATVAQRMAGEETHPSLWMPVIAFMLVFIAVVLVVNLLARMLRRLVSMSLMGWADRLGGVILFVGTYIFIFSVLLFYAVQTGWIGEATLNSSRVYPYIRPVAPAMIGLLGKVFPVFSELFENLKEFFGTISDKI